MTARYSAARWLRSATLLFACAFAFAFVLVGGCGARAPALYPTRPVVETPGWVRIALADVDRDILKFDVMNLSNTPLIVLRDNVMLQTARGALRRLPGGTETIYHVAPFSAQKVHVRYDLRQVRAGERLRIHFQGAVLVAGRPFLIAPVILDVQR